MNTFNRKRFGLGVAFVSVFAGLALYLFGVPLVTYKAHSMREGLNDGVITMHIAVHWSVVVLLVTAVIGGVLAARSRHEKANG